MSSIIEGYNYDIFISYRQKDNKHDGWVTEFVDNLKGELESTFKEEISVYFDINPHDGLLETHDVDESLKEKLKCLIFIPIISRTYCDPKSFAWEHEFRAFVELASNDKFGLKVRLPNGNVASRVLPVQIHDLDNDDIRQCDSVLGGVLRGIEFIYKESGFNRPLKPDDDEKLNLNKTKYRNQITKVALAIKEISLGMKVEPTSVLTEKMQEKELFQEIRKGERIEIREKPKKLPKQKLLSGVIITAIIIIAAILAFPKIFKQDRLEDLRTKNKISIAVMPFQNMTNDTTWNIWQNGIQNELINILTNSEELKVKQTKSITGLLTQQDSKSYASITPSIASAISKKLDAGVFLYGSIKQAGSVLRVNAQLINTKTEEVLKSFTIERPAKEELIFQIIDTLSLQIRNFLIISELKKEFSFSQQVTLTASAEAYRYYIYGLNAWKKGDNPTAIDWYSHALNIDTNFILAALDLSSIYRDIGMFEEAEELFLKVYRKRDKMSIYWKLTTNFIYSRYNETPYEELKYLIQLYELDDQYFFPRMIGNTYLDLFQYDKAIPALEESKDIYEKLGNLDPDDFTILGFAYHKARQYKKEKKLYREAEKHFPNNADLIYRQAILLLSEGDTISANRYIKEYVSIRKKESDPEIGIIADLGVLYSETGILDKAEEYYREALSIEPDSSGRMNALAYFLIEKDRDVKEGLELVNKALKLKPDNYDYLDTQGWGLYKQGKYKEALDVLQKSWYLRRKLADYNHSAYLHLEEAKKAVASQKNN